jgi:Cys-tRNA(Pro) deacylase
MTSHEEKVPATLAIRQLREQKILFEPHFYTYLEHGGTGHAARSLQVPEHAVIKTLVMETDLRRPLIVLMHGDCEVSTRQLARIIGANKVTPCDEQAAHKHTGYTVGGISPFGTRSRLPVYVESTIFDLPLIYVNGGKRGFLVSINPASLRGALEIVPVQAAIPAER